MFNGGKTTCIINFVPDTELRPADVPLHRPQPLEKKNSGAKDLVSQPSAALRFELEAV